MPLPTPNSGESNADFMDRCMGSDAIKEFPDQKQRVAVCMRQWRDKEMNMAELTTETLADVPIMRAGSGFHGTGCPPEGCEFTLGDLDAIIEAYWANKEILKPPVKLGHDENQALLQADGFPSAGFVGNLRRRADKMYADFLNVPKAIADLVRAGAYHNVSVELNQDYEVNGQKYPQVLTGLALLGADLPAIEGLGGITALYHSLHLAAEEGARIIVTTTDSTNGATSTVNLSTQPGDPGSTQEDSEMSNLNEVRQALGLGEDGDILAAITALQTRALDIATGEKGEANQLRRELDETRKSYLQEANDLRQRVLEVEAKMRDERAEHEVDLAIQQGRVEPKDRDVALGLAKTNPDAFKKFSANLRVDLVERGSATDAQMADLEPTADELRVAQSMGVDPDKIRAQKAADKGIKLPS